METTITPAQAEAAREAARASVDALVAQYPRQIVNRNHLLAFIESAEVLRVKRDIKTKMGLQAAKGELVCVDPVALTDYGLRVFWSTHNRLHVHAVQTYFTR